MAHIIAAQNPRYRVMPERLKQKTGEDFALITNAADLEAEQLAGVNPRYVFLVHWSQRVPASIYQRFETVVFHMTDLPFGRGGTPLQNLIARGIYQTKITALRCEAEIDAGPIYMKRDLSLDGTAEEIYRRAGGIIEGMIADILKTNPIPVPQSGEPVLFRRRRRNDGDISKLGDLRQVYDYIRMLDADGYPSAFVETDRLLLEFSAAVLEQDQVLATVRISRKKGENE